MKQLVDVVNFNADASCLSSDQWIKIIQGGTNSQFYKWLSLYVQYNKKVTLGLIGSTIIDLKHSNNESLELINQNPSIFEIIIRPFSHDISLLRTNKGFIFNVSLGKRLIENEFSNVSNIYLPPEFMLTNTQVNLLSKLDVKSVFINSSRFPNEIRNRIPEFPYKVKGVEESSLNCFPVKGECTFDYLFSLQDFNCTRWNSNILADEREVVFTWRDGESVFLIPDGISREKYWLENEDQQIERKQFKDIQCLPNEKTKLDENHYHNYPVHSFSAWMEGFRMLGFIKRIANIEEHFKIMNWEQKIIWLHTITSDILSSVEKKSPQIQLKSNESDEKSVPYIIQRKEKGFEGEEYLYILEQSIRKGHLPKYVFESNDAHLIKLRNKITHLELLLKD